MKLVIATRGSELALWQAKHVQARLCAREPALACELLVLTTTGDRILDRPLADIGGKALFVKEIEAALLDGRAHVAVHSMKDVPAESPPELHIAAISTREDPRDALLSNHPGGLVGLPPGAVIGTSSVRRQCQLQAARPDVRFADLRGNVPTRVRKLRDGEFDAIVLAAAGLMRLGLQAEISEALPPEVCLPAVCQGVLAIQTRRDDAETTARVAAALHDAEQAPLVEAERAFLAAFGGSCKTPLAAMAQWDKQQAGQGHVRLVAFAGRLATRQQWRCVVDGPAADAASLGQRAHRELLALGAQLE